ncbi:type II secretion system protein [Candidatus Omnitrophota bacterium]
MKIKRGFTLLESIAVIMIIAILTGIAIAKYSKPKENILDKEAIASLKLLRSVQGIYHKDGQTYYASAVIGEINDNLKVSLPTAGSRNWNYEVWNNGCSQATRNGGDGRIWFLRIDDADEEPDVGNGDSCP